MGIGSANAVGYLLGLGTRPFPVQRGDVITLGREHDNTIPLSDAIASRRHAVVECTGNGQVFLKDLGSSNGTFLNDKRMTERVQLKNGDVFRIGGKVISYISADATADQHKLAARQTSLMTAQATLVMSGSGGAEPGLGTAPTLAGNLADQSLPQVLQYIAAGRKSGEMRIAHETLEGSIALTDGGVYFADAGPHKGIGAIMALAALKSGTFEFYAMADPPVRPVNVTMPTVQIIFEICRQMDESAAQQ